MEVCRIVELERRGFGISIGFMFLLFIWENEF